MPNRRAAKGPAKRAVRRKGRRRTAVASCLLVLAPGLLGIQARAAERITLRNGFTLDCLHREPMGDKLRLYLDPADSN